MSDSTTLDKGKKQQQETDFKLLKRMLVMGLSACAEVERLRNEYDASEQLGRAPRGISRPILQGDFFAADYAEAMADLDALADQLEGAAA